MTTRHPIDDVLAQWEDALRRSDVKTLAQLTAADGEFWSPGQQPLKGPEAVAASFKELFKKYTLEQTFDEVERIVTDGWVLLRGMERNVVKPRDGVGSTVVLHRVFTVLRRDPDGQWRFARGMTQFVAPSPAPGPL